MPAVIGPWHHADPGWRWYHLDYELENMKVNPDEYYVILSDAQYSVTLAVLPSHNDGLLYATQWVYSHQEEKDIQAALG